jgi:hypothetical protein
VAKLEKCPAPSSLEMAELIDVRKVDILNEILAANFKEANDIHRDAKRSAPSLESFEVTTSLHPRLVKKLLKHDDSLRNDQIHFYPPLDGVCATGPAA